MHMSDALLSPEVAGVMWATSAGAVAWSSVQVRKQLKDGKLQPAVMGLGGAFIFAVQMLNFAIPGTGSSGHLAGGVLLSFLFGGPAAVLILAVVLAVQALFFGDGGILAYGCNLFNMGIIPALFVVPAARKFMGIIEKRWGGAGLFVWITIAGLISLVAGAAMVSVETCLSGVTALSLLQFLACMVPIHIAIGLVEGCVSAAILRVAAGIAPELDTEGIFAKVETPSFTKRRWQIIGGGLFLSCILGGVVSWFASVHPDGLEWSLERLGIKETLPATKLHQKAQALQEKTAIMPDYDFPAPRTESQQAEEEPEKWPNISLGNSIAGVSGALAVLVLAMLIGILFRGREVNTNVDGSAAGTHA
ncbi:MAG: cobalamin biosynthesis protein CbiM [Lentisphaerae bacterium]|nr:MAG: cobalamin biosynthesis protein CbiM [Lentisphaerota bacterium]